ncbi:MAG: ribosome biogenesis GTPase Der [Elusimicrobia bacterium]|nr:ribosome biogenesis GTPase Der [Elusimicrobiota bacterium]
MVKTVAIVGRPNVGKSTLFNTLINRKEALTSPNPGLTRDRHYSYFSPDGENVYLLIDTGGIILDDKRSIVENVNLQVELAVEQADLLLFVVDIREGLLPLDERICDRLRKSSKPIIVAANKADTPDKDILISDFYGLGLDNVIALSAQHKRNIYGLISGIRRIIPESRQEKRGRCPRLCVVGRPNVGKSTLVNRIAGEERVIVDSEPGTTRNPAKCHVRIKGRDWELVDMAGLWRKSRGKELEEIISMIAARRELEKADVCIFLMDLTEPLTFQDKRIAGWIIEAGTSVVIAGNKADLVEDSPEIRSAYGSGLYAEMPFMSFAPFLVISAKTGNAVEELYDELQRVYESSQKKIKQEELDMFLAKMLSKRPPPESANERPRVIRLVQKKVNPPVFSLVIDHYRLDKIPQHWKNYVRNFIYEEFRYYGVPVVINYIKYKKSREDAGI